MDWDLLGGTVNKLQQEINEWQMKTFKSSDKVSKYRHLEREIKELGEAIEWGSPTTPVAMEIADCLMLLYGIASLYNIDVIEALSKKLEINKKRKWGSPDKEGVVEHIEPEELYGNCVPCAGTGKDYNGCMCEWCRGTGDK